MKIRFQGAARQVTGSCYQLFVNGKQYLVDCGMQQGDGGKERNRAPFAFSPSDISSLFLTHAHIDHSGMIPRLVRDGFRGKIITTAATADLVEIMLLDSAHIQEKDAEWMTKKSFRRGEDVVYEPLYTIDDARACFSRFEKRRYGEEIPLGDGLSYTFTDAGHILGSGSFELHYVEGDRGKKIVFSGDVGKSGNPIINDPIHTETADYVVIESTYGNRLHRSLEDSIEELAQAVRTTFRRGGNVLIPAFAVGRTQDLIYILNNLVREGRLDPVDVYVDSPLAEEATRVYLSYPDLYDEEARRLFTLKKGNGIRLHFTTEVAESQGINRIKSGAVILAGSGMCEGGRIAHHLKHNLWRSECSIVFVGFQARGTLGRRIVDGAKTVKVLGEETAVRAQIYTIGGFSAHADQKELLQWLALFSNKPEVFIVHGEEDVALDFEKSVKEQLGLATHVPYKGETFEI